MISVGIDVSKEKSTVCILKPYGEIVRRPFEVCHVEKELSELTSMLLRLNDDVRVVMEATGIYHLMRVESVLELTHLLDYTMPGIKTLLKGWNETNGKDKLGDFGGVSIPVSFSVSPKWLKVLTGVKQKEKIAVDYFDTETLEMKQTEMFVEGYKAVLVKDTSYKGLWKVSFTLKEF